MLKTLLALAVMALYALSLYGWGRAICRLAKRDPEPWPLSLAFGLGGWVFLAGILNALGIAFAGPLDASVVAGWAMALAPLRARPWRDLRLSRLRDPRALRAALLWALALAIMLFTIDTQLPPAAFNYADDFQKYFVHPVRMLETGTLRGSPLSAIGFQDIGGEAALHAFVLAHFPIVYLNGVDAVFGLALCLAIPIEFGLRQRLPFIPILLSALLVFVIDPQYVNIGALYIGSALIMALTFLVASPRSPDSAQETFPAPPSLVGLVYAALIAIKPTFAPFVAAHFFGLAGAVAIGTRSAKMAVRWSALAAVYALVFIAPWLAVHGRNYWYAIKVNLSAAGTSAASVLVAPDAPDSDWIAWLISPRDSFYGDAPLHYTILVLLVGGLALAPLILLKRVRWDRRHSPAYCLAGSWFAALLTYLVLTVIVAPRVVDSDTALRYFCPVIIGLTPAVALLSLAYVLQPEAKANRRVVCAASALASALALAVFSATFMQRIDQALSSGSILAFRKTAMSRDFLAYNDAVLRGPVKGTIENLQSLVPEGESLMAWIGAPFYLDFRRNRIYDVELGGLVNPWARLPPAHFVLWQFGGGGVDDERSCTARASSADAHERKLGSTCLEFRRLLARLANNGEILYRDGVLVLFRLPVAL